MKTLHRGLTATGCFLYLLRDRVSPVLRLLLIVLLLFREDSTLLAWSFAGGA
jgi:hypothetical protein